MPTIIIDNQEITVSDGCTILEAARQAGITIPTLCFLPGARPETSCLVCQVRLVDPNRPGFFKTVPSCATLVQEGMVVESDSPAIYQSRKTALELLLSDHRGDCFGPCTHICPTGLDIPRLLRAFAAGNQSAAESILFESMAFPSILGRLCGHPCESGCRRKILDQPIPIQAIHRTVSDRQLASKDSPTAAAANTETGKQNILSGKSIAIVGAGPTGLTAAFLLARQGANVVVFEKNEFPGGRLQTEFVKKLDSPNVLNDELARIWDQGVVCHINSSICEPEQLADLSIRSDAVLWTAGAGSLVDLEAILSPSESYRWEPNSDRWKNLFWIGDNLFVAGDARRGKNSPLVLNAGEGRWAALSIAKFLCGDDLTRWERSGLRPWSIRSFAPTREELLSLAESQTQFRQNDLPNDSPVDNDSPDGNTTDTLVRSAENCLHCDCRAVDDCRLRHWSEVYQANPEQWGRSSKSLTVLNEAYNVTREPSKCIDCGLCVQIANQSAREDKTAKYNAVRNNPTENNPTETTTPGQNLGHSGLSFRGRGFSVQLCVPFDDPLTESMSEQTAQRCADACPTAAFYRRT